MADDAFIPIGAPIGPNVLRAPNLPPVTDRNAPGRE